MGKSYIKMETNRSGYGVEQCGRTMTVRELIEYLGQFDEDTPVYYSNDNGYTYGRISQWDIDEVYEEDEE